jgi:hypothetical protein
MAGAQVGRGKLLKVRVWGMTGRRPLIAVVRAVLHDLPHIRGHRTD